MMRSLTVIFLSVIFLFEASFAATEVASDPSRIGVGARILGMGKSYVAVADDLGGIFLNPASLSNVSKFQLTSMSGKFINEYNYLNFGAALPLPVGSLGLGYVNSNIGFTAPGMTIEVVDGIRVIASSTEGSSYDYSAGVFFLSWGAAYDNLAAGALLKFFSSGMSGPGIVNGIASGNDLDIGVTYQPVRYSKVGMVLQNILPANLGGKIRWQSGVEESVPSLIKFGISMNILGEEGLSRVGRNELRVSIDGDFAPLRLSIPTLYHLGIEWSPLALIALRAGIDQETVGRGEAGLLEPSNNLTAGIGLLFDDFRFDYAFHQYNQLTENDTHYFSITYGVGKKKPEPRKGPFFSFKPGDRSVVYGEEVEIGGRVLGKVIEHVTFNGVETSVVKNEFKVKTPLATGKNYFYFKGYDKKWDPVGAEKLRILRLTTFKDLAADYWARGAVEDLASAGVISGFPDGTFRPEKTVTRAEIAVLLMKSKTGAASEEPHVAFKDVSNKHWAAGYIAQAAAAGLLKGYPDGTFRPGVMLTRAEGVAIMARFARLPKPALSEMPFADVPGRHWAVKDIAAAKEAGLLKYLAGKPFEPAKDITRAEVAEILSRTADMAQRIKDITEWEKD